MIKCGWRLLQNRTASSRHPFSHDVMTPEVIASLKVLGFDSVHPGGAAPAGSLPLSLPVSIRHARPVLPTQQEVRQRYRELAQQFHPDLSGGDSQRMKHINAAYELLQSSGVLWTSHQQNEAEYHEGKRMAKSSEKGGAHSKDGERKGWTSSRSTSTSGETPSRKPRKTPFARSAVHPQFASGGDQSWALKSALEWKAMIGNVEDLRLEELQNPANHPLSHSKFFSMEEDATIYQMLRGGATIPQVARTLGKQATFIEKRLHNVQFKLRVQYILRAEKKRLQQEEAKKNKKKKPASAAFQKGGMSTTGAFWGREGSSAHLEEDPSWSGRWKLNQRSTSSGARGPNMTLSAIRPYAGAPCAGDAEEAPFSTMESSPYSSFSLRHPVSSPYGEAADPSSPRKNVWEPSVSRWEEQAYYADLTLEEKAKYDRITTRTKK